MKHLKVKATLSKDKRTCKIEILDQSHRCSEFSDKVIISKVERYEAGVFVHKNTALLSAGSPCIFDITHYNFRSWSYVLPKEVDMLILLRGDNPYNDNNTLNYNSNRWPQIKAAIEAYNEKFKD